MANDPLGCLYESRSIGAWGRMGCFSLNEFKHISCGDGGIVVTDDEALASRLRLATDKGYNRQPGAAMRQATFLANNYRMTELQAAVALAQLDKLDDIVARRRRWCAALSEDLQFVEGITLPEATPGCDPSWWFYLLRVVPDALGADADAFVEALGAEGVRASAHYIGTCIYRYPLFADHGAYAHGEYPCARRDYAQECCPGAEAILETGVQLPVNEAYSDTDREEIARAIRRVARWFRQRRPRRHWNTGITGVSPA